MQPNTQRPFATLRNETARAAFAILLGGAILQGCTGVHSEPAEPTPKAVSGLIYALPTTRIPITLSIDGANDRVALTAAPPVYVADEAHRFSLKANYSPFHAEVFEISLNGAGLLTSLTYNSDGRLDETAAAAGGSIGLFLEKALAPNGGIAVTTTSIDVGTLATSVGAQRPKPLVELNERFNSDLRRVLKNLDLKGKPFLSEMAAKQGSLIEFEVSRTGHSTRSPAANPDCGRGLCYRLPVEYSVRAKFFDGTVQEHLIYVPNASPAYTVALDRGLFTKWKNSVTLENGMPTQVRFETDGSEAERLVSLPTDIAGKIIAGLTQRGELSSSRASLLRAEADYLKARQETKEAASAIAKIQSELRRIPDDLVLFQFSAGSPLSASNADLRIPSISSDKATTATESPKPKRSGNPGSGA